MIHFRSKLCNIDPARKIASTKKYASLMLIILIKYAQRCAFLYTVSKMECATCQQLITKLLKSFKNGSVVVDDKQHNKSSLHS